MKNRGSQMGIVEQGERTGQTKLSPGLSMWETELMASMGQLHANGKAMGNKSDSPVFWTLLTDASVSPRQAQSGLGAVLLDGLGALSQEIEERASGSTRDTRLAELWAIELGVRLLREKIEGLPGRQAILVLCDCQPAVEALRQAQSVSQATQANMGQADSIAEGSAQDIARGLAAQLNELGEWQVSWVPREKLSRSNELARKALGLRPENKIMATWNEQSWTPSKQVAAWERRKQRAKEKEEAIKESQALPGIEKKSSSVDRLPQGSPVALSQRSGREAQRSALQT